MARNEGLSAAALAEMLNHFTPVAQKVQLGKLMTDLCSALNALDAVVLGKATLVIKAGSSPIVKSSTPYAAAINGVMIPVAISDMAGIVGTLATAKSAAWAFYVDASGNLTASAKTADTATAAAAAALLPAPPTGLAQIGFITVSNASGAGFIGGTTALDAASITTAFYDTTGPVLGAPVSAGDLASR